MTRETVKLVAVAVVLLGLGVLLQSGITGFVTSGAKWSISTEFSISSSSPLVLSLSSAFGGAQGYDYFAFPSAGLSTAIAGDTLTITAKPSASSVERATIRAEKNGISSEQAITIRVTDARQQFAAASAVQQFPAGGKTYSRDETVYTNGSLAIGTKTGDAAFDVSFTRIIKSNELRMEFSHNSASKQSVGIEGISSYALSNPNPAPSEKVIVIVPLVSGKVPEFRLRIGTSELYNLGEGAVAQPAQPPVQVNVSNGTQGSSSAFGAMRVFVEDHRGGRRQAEVLGVRRRSAGSGFGAASAELINVTIELAVGKTLDLEGVPNETLVVRFEEGVRSDLHGNFAIDLSNLAFSRAIYSQVATGNFLQSCKQWNYTEQRCDGTWSKIRNLTPGERYSIELTPGDPAFGEGGITRVLSGVTTLTATGTLVPIGATVNNATSVLFFSSRSNINTPDGTHVQGRLFNATHIEFNRPTAAVAMNINWYLAEFDGGVAVTRGRNSIGVANAEASIYTGRVFNSSATFIVPGGFNQTGTTAGADDLTRFRIINTTHVGLVFQQTGEVTDIADWQIVEYNGSVVQRGLQTMASGSALLDVNLSTAVNTSRSFMIFSYSISGNFFASGALLGRLLNATQVRFERNQTGASADIAWEVIQLPTGSSVQHNFADFNSATTARNIAITSVNTSRAVAFSPNSAIAGFSFGAHNFTADDIMGHGLATFNLTNSTNLELTRIPTGSNASISWFVVEFNAPFVDSIAPLVNTLSISPQLINRTNSLNITSNVTDEFSLDKVFANITFPNGTVQFIRMTNTTKDLYNLTFVTTSVHPAGLYNVTIYANDTTSNINGTVGGNFTVKGNANLILSLNQSQYFQGTASQPSENPGFGIKVFIPYQARLVDPFLGTVIGDATCNVTANNTGSFTSLSFNSTTGNYTGELDTFREYANTTFTVSCVSQNYNNITNFTTARIKWENYIAEIRNISYGSVYSNLTTATTFLTKVRPSTNSVLAKTFNVTISPNSTNISLFDLDFCGSNTNINCTFLRDYLMHPEVTLRANLSASADNICDVMLCQRIKTTNLETVFKTCGPGQNVTTSPTVFQQVAPLDGVTIQQGFFISMGVVCNAKPSVVSPTAFNLTLYYNYSGQPVSLEISNPFNTFVSSQDIAHSQSALTFTIGPNQRLNLTLNHTRQFNNTLSEARSILVRSVLEVLVQFKPSAIPNATRLFNSTGQLWASDNASMGAPNTLTVSGDDIVTYQTEAFPPLSLRNETLQVIHRDALRDNETSILNASARKVWQAEVRTIFASDVEIENITAFTNYSAYFNVAADSEFQFFANLTNSSGTFNITSQIAVNRAAKTVTFPARHLSTVTFGVTAQDTKAPEIRNASAAPPSINRTQSVNITANVTDGVGVSQVFANITFPDSTATLLRMTNQTGSIFNATFTASLSDPGGQYNITIIANDTSNNFNSTSDGTFNVTVNAGRLNITLLLPLPGQLTNVSQNATFIVRANVTCLDGGGASCGSITALARHNSTFNFTALGTGADGSLTVSSAGTIVNNYTYLQQNAGAGAITIAANSTANFQVGQEIFIIQVQNGTQGTGGVYEFARIIGISGNNFTLDRVLLNSYFNGAQNASNSTTTQIVLVRNFANVIINSGASITAPAWDGFTGGIVIFRSNGTVNVSGAINATAIGFRGGLGGNADGGENGESFDGKNGKGGDDCASGANCAAGIGTLGGGAGQQNNGSSNTAGIRGGGGGGGDEAGADATNGGGGGAGGGYGGGGGGGGGSGDAGGASGNGSTGGQTGVSAGGGGGAPAGTIALTGGTGGAAGSDGTGGTNAFGGAAGSGSTTGTGGGANIFDADSGGSGGGGGGIYGAANLLTAFFGSGGGGGGDSNEGTSTGRDGAAGGGMIFIAARNIVVQSSGRIQADGGNGTDGGADADPVGASGGGAGGSIRFRVVNATLGAGQVTALGGQGGAVAAGTTSNGAGGGGGGVGRIRLDLLEISGNSEPGSAFNTTEIPFSGVAEVFVDINVTSGAVPFFTGNEQPQTCTSIAAGESCIVSWTVNATGAISRQFKFSVNATGGEAGIAANASQNATVQIVGPAAALGVLELTSLTPAAGNTTEVTQNSTFNFSVRVNCTGSGSCGLVRLAARFNRTGQTLPNANISVLLNETPFFILQSSPRDIDVVVTILDSTTFELRKYKNVSGGWLEKNISDPQGGIEALEIGDANNDGLNDIVVSFAQASGVTDVRIYEYNVSTGNWVETNVSGEIALNAEDVAIGDADNDGKNDIAVAFERTASGQPATGVVRVRMYGFNGTRWNEFNISPIGYQHSAQFVEIGDADNDGLNEIVVVFANVTSSDNTIESRVALFKNQSGGWVQYNVTPLRGGQQRRAERIKIGDPDNDGRNEIVTGFHNWTPGLSSNANGTLAIFDNETGVWVETNITSTNAIMDGLDIGDADGDGRIDVAVIWDISTSGTGQSYAALYTNVSGFYNQTNLTPVLPAISRDIAIGDADGDGVTDIVIAMASDLRWLRNITGNIVNVTIHTFASGIDIDSAEIGDPDNDVRQNNLSCGTLSAGQSCTLNYTIKVTGPIGTFWRIDLNATSDTVTSNDSADPIISIVGAPVVAVIANVSVRNLTQAGLSFLLNESFNITVNASAAAGLIDRVLANITLPDGTKVQARMLNNTKDIFNLTWTNMTLKGRYNVTFIANNSLGTVNATVTTFFERRASAMVIDLVDASGQPLSASVVIDANVSGMLTLNITPNSTLSLIRVFNYSQNSPNSVIRFGNQTNAGAFDNSARYYLDVSGLNFTLVNVTRTASMGEIVHVCKQFDAIAESCRNLCPAGDENGDCPAQPEGMWVAMANITAGQQYSFLITNTTDPGFGEFSVAQRADELSTNSTSPVIATQANFTPSVTQFLLLGYGEVQGNTTAGDVRSRLLLNGSVGLGNLSWQPDASRVGNPPGDYQPFFTHRLVNLSSSLQNLSVQFFAGSGQLSFIRRARALAFAVKNADALTNETGTEFTRITTTGTAYMSVVNLSYTPPSSQSLLVLATAEVLPNSTTESISVRLTINGTEQGFVELEGEAASDVELFATHAVISNATAGVSQNFSIQAVSETTANKALRRARITVVPLSSFFHNSSEGVSRNTSAAAVLQNKTFLFFDLPSTQDVIVVASADVNISSATNGEFLGVKAFVDGTEIGNMTMGASDTTDDFSFITVQQLQLSGGAHTARIAFNKPAGTAGTVAISRARITVIPVGGNAPVVQQLILNTTNPLTNDTNQNLTLYVLNVTDADGDPVQNITDWRRNNLSIAILNLPFETNTVSTVQGAIRDYSTYRNNATLDASDPAAVPSWTASGRVGGAYSFDGIDDWINTSIDLQREDNFTITTWFKANDIVFARHILWQGNETDNGWGNAAIVDGTEHAMHLSIGNIMNASFAHALTFFLGYTDAGFDNNTLNCYINFTDTANWTYVAVQVFNMSVAPACRMFVNGELAAQDFEATVQAANRSRYTVPLRIGRPGPATRFFNGTIDEVIIYNRTLSGQQIRQFYLDGNASRRTNTIVSQEVRPNETWQGCVTPNDRIFDGATVCSTNLTPGNTPPAVTRAFLNTTKPPTNDTDQNLTLFITVVDVDGNPVKNVTDWRINGTNFTSLNMPFEVGSNATFTRDYSANGYNAVVFNATFNASGGHDGWGAYEFNGLNSYMNITPNAIINRTQGTIEVWAKANTFVTSQIVVWAGQTSGNGYGADQELHLSINHFNATQEHFGFTFWYGDGDPAGSVAQLRPDGNWTYVFSGNLTAGVWYHVVVTWDLPNNITKMFINGTLVATDNTTGDEPYLTSAWQPEVRLGRPGPVTRLFNGSLDEVRIYPRALTAEQVFALYNDRNLRIVSNETRINDTWFACVTPNDRMLEGNTVCSNNITVVPPTNSLPSVLNVQLNATNPRNSSLDNLTLTFIAIDADNDPIKNITNFFVNRQSLALVNMPLEANGANVSKDYSPQKNNGTSFGAAFSGSGGYDGFGAFVFNDTDYMEINTTGFRTSNMTLTARVNPSGFVGSEQYIFGHLQAASSRIELYTAGGQLRVGLGNSHLSGSGGTLAAGRWYHIALVFNITNFTVYVDGVVNFTGAFSGLSAFAGIFDIGNDGNASSRSRAWNGTIDEVMVFNRSLSAQQIDARFRNRTSVIVSQETVRDDIWQGCVTPNDKIDDGAERCSNNITIRSAPPSIAQVILNTTNTATNDTNQNLTLFIINATDFENDPIKNITAWYVNNLSMASIVMPFENSSHELAREYANGINGTPAGGVFWNATGGIDGWGAFEFDGFDDFIAMPTNLTQWLNGTASLSVWLKTTQVGNDSVFIAPGITGVEQLGGANDVFWGWLSANGSLGIQAGDIAGAQTTNPINDGQWHHVVMTRNETSGVVQIYVDGRFNSSGTSETGRKNTSFASIGRIEDVGGFTPEEFRGTLDEFMVFPDRALSAEQVLALYQNKTTLIVSQETNINDTWYACVTPNDRRVDGSPVCSNNVTINAAAAAAANITVVSLTPAAGASFFLNGTVSIAINATGTSPIDRALANVTLPNGTVLQFQMVNLTKDIYNVSFGNLTLRGQYNITFIVNDTTGSVFTGTTNFFHRITFGGGIDLRIRIAVDDENTSFAFANYTSTIVTNVSGILNLSVSINDTRIKVINITNFNSNSLLSNIDIDDWAPGRLGFAIFGIEPSGTNFTSATVTVNASGDRFYKCGNWDFTDRNCLGNFTPLANVTPGLLYSFTMNATDPGFFEGSSAIDVALAPLNFTTLVIAFVKNNTNELAFRILDTNGTEIKAETIIDATVDTQSRVSVQNLNTTHFAIAWVDGPSDAVRFQIFLRNGTNTTQALNADTAVGAFTDVSLSETGDRFQLCYADDVDNDASFYVFDNAGAQIIGETDADINIAPALALQNLISCTGINGTRFAYMWFDDSANDVIFAILNETNGTVAGPTTLNAAAGETAQVDVAAVGSDRFAMVYYDAAEDDISIAIRGADNSVILASTDVDTNAGTESRVAIASMRRNRTVNEELFVIAYWNQSSNRIMAGVFNSTGSAVSGIFTVDTQANSAFRLLDVAARSGITNSSICPGFFAVAYSNSTNQGIYKGFSVSGSAWDGNCNEAPDAPVLVAPPNNSVTVNRTPLFVWLNATDADGDPKTYQIEVSRNSTFTDIVFNVSGINESQANTSLPSPVVLDVDRQYFWRVKAFDGKVFGAFSNVSNFTVNSFIALSLLVNTVNFSQVIRGQNLTTNGTNGPFVVRNDGNIPVNVTITGTQLFQNALFPGISYQFNISVNKTGSFNEALSQLNFTNMTSSSSARHIRDLNWTDSNDTAATNIRILIPSDEPPGNLTSNVTFTGGIN